MNVTTFPLCWPTGWERTQYRKHHTLTSFRNAPFSSSRTKLSDELDRLKASDIILSTNMPLRLDGRPRADVLTPDDPGVAVYFTLRGRPMVMARDYYLTVGQNIRSLALAIDHLRGLERHGGATMFERAFTGFSALPDPSRKQTWREVLRIEPGSIEKLLPHNRQEFARQAYLRLAQYCHPDKGGSDGLMAEVNAAWEEAQKELGS